MMQELVNRLNEIKVRVNFIANEIDVNCSDSEKQYRELSELADELGVIICDLGIYDER